MENIKDILLKLHYLKLEVHTIYQILLKLQQHQDMTEQNIKKVLNCHYDAYKKISVYKIKEQIYSNHIDYKTIICDDYPKALHEIFMPPLVLFYKGDYNLVHKKSIAVIGSRLNSDYGQRACEYFVEELVKKDIVIISGLAKGIDTIAHQKAINCSGKTIAVLGSGLLQVYPKENHNIANEIATNHLLISEYSPMEPPLKTHFPFRNRIVSGLSNGILVVEAAKKSGTLITCDYALDQSKEVFAIPGNILSKTSEGTNHLIKQGAKLVSVISDIMEYL